MKQLLERVIDQLDQLDTRLDSVDKTLVRQEANLKEHMRRTELLEKHYEKLHDEIYTELDPINAHVHQVKGVLKFTSIALIPLIAAAIGYLIKPYL